MSDHVFFTAAQGGFDTVAVVVDAPEGALVKAGSVAPSKMRDLKIVQPFAEWTEREGLKYALGNAVLEMLEEKAAK